jgi:hypothetical protein
MGRGHVDDVAGLQLHVLGLALQHVPEIGDDQLGVAECAAHDVDSGQVGLPGEPLGERQGAGHRHALPEGEERRGVDLADDIDLLGESGGDADVVPVLELDVEAQVPLAQEPGEVHRQHLPAPGDEGVGEVRKLHRARPELALVEPAGPGDCLAQAHVRDQGVDPWAPHLPADGVIEAVELGDDHRHPGLDHEPGQPLGDRLGQLVDGAPSRLDVADQRERDHAVRAHRDGGEGQVGLVVDRDGEHVALAQGGDRAGLGHGTPKLRQLLVHAHTPLDPQGRAL